MLIVFISFHVCFVVVQYLCVGFSIPFIETTVLLAVLISSPSFAVLDGLFRDCFLSLVSSCIFFKNNHTYYLCSSVRIISILYSKRNILAVGLVLVVN